MNFIHRYDEKTRGFAELNRCYTFFMGEMIKWKK